MIKTTLLKHLKRSVPLLAITTADPVSLSAELAKGVQDDTVNYNTVTWDTATGYQCNNKSTWEAVRANIASMDQCQNRTDYLKAIVNNGRFQIHETHIAIEAMKHLPADTIFVINNADPLLKNPNIQQALLGLRDGFKGNSRSVVMIGHNFSLPSTLRADTVILDEPLPNRQQLQEVLRRITDYVKLDMSEQDIATAIDAVSGLSLFQAEQSLALAVEPTGFDYVLLYNLKKQLVNQTKGLSVHYQTYGYDTIGGLEGIKSYINRLMNGGRPPQIIVWLDELDKSGINHTNDSNGINADMLGTFLSYMEDTNVMGVCLHGIPGAGKSALIKATGAQFNRLIIRLDLNAMKGSYVGESETNLRSGLRLINSLGQGNVLVMATTNSLRGLDSAMMSRFTDVFFFSLPKAEELAPIWTIQRQLYNIRPSYDTPISTGWVGRNIKHCCDKSARLGMTLQEASKMIIPVGVSSAREIEMLYGEANNRYLCASTGEVFRA